jgi:signal transduction histidine kinase
MTSYPIAFDELKNLAPSDLPTYRTLRYNGADMDVPISAFAPSDNERIYRLYGVLNDLLKLLQQTWENEEKELAAIKAFIQQVQWTRFLQFIQQLGADSYDEHSEYYDALRQVVHDIKGGGFLALSIHLQLLEMGKIQKDGMSRLFFLSRDHLKIMRNAIRDLDPPFQEHERVQRDHSARLLVEKWDHAIHQMGTSSAEVVLDCQFDGIVSERCLEFSALDRVLYNLINNAARFTADNKVYFVIFALPEEQPRNLRFVIYNRMHEAHQHTLYERYGDNLGAIFRGGFTTGGSGLGLRICADFVNNAYGINNFDQGLAGKYFGARCIDNYFVNWIHWPIAGD